MLARILMAIAIVAFIPSGAVAQSAGPIVVQSCNTAPSGFVYDPGKRSSQTVDVSGSTCVTAVPAALPTASSTPLVGTFTTSTVAPTSGAASISAGVVTAGPFTPTPGRDVLVVFRGANTGPAQLYTSNDGCTTLDPITIGGTVSPLAQWAATPINEVADTAGAFAGRTYCLRFTPNGAGSFVVTQ